MVRELFQVHEEGCSLLYRHYLIQVEKAIFGSRHLAPEVVGMMFHQISKVLDRRFDIGFLEVELGDTTKKVSSSDAEVRFRFGSE